MSKRTMDVNVWTLGLRRLALSVCVAGALSSSAAAQTYMVTDLGTLGGSQSSAIAVNAAGQVTGDALITGDSAWHAFLTSGGAMLDLGTFGGTSSSTATALNAAGQVTGCAPTTGNAECHAFLFSNGVKTDLGTLGGPFSIGVAVNASGQVAGRSNIGNGNNHAFRYANGVMTDLGTFGGSWSVANAINDAGYVTGWAVSDYAAIAFLYDGSELKNLGTLGGPQSYGLAINAAGQVAGESYTGGDGNLHAFLYSNGVMSDLGTLGGTTSRGAAINNAGQVTGTSSVAGDVEWHPFLYSNGAMADLGSLGGLWSEVWGINAVGHVVGNASLPDTVATHAFVSRGGPMIDLNTLIPSDSGWTLVTANAVNDAGQIAGAGTINGQPHAFLLTPVSTRTARVQQPIDPDGSSVFNAKRGVIPVRFTLAVNGTPTCTLPPATIALTRTSGGTIGPIDESLYIAAADDGQNFRIADCQYLYNLAASGLGAGHYRVDIAIDGRVIGHGEFSLR